MLLTLKADAGRVRLTSEEAQQDKQLLTDHADHLTKKASFGASHVKSGGGGVSGDVKVASSEDDSSTQSGGTQQGDDSHRYFPDVINKGKPVPERHG